MSYAPVLLLLMGVPGAGKSTVAAQLIREQVGHPLPVLRACAKVDP